MQDQADGINTRIFLYDNGGVVSVTHTTSDQTKKYLYRRNAQGDVIALLDNSGAVVVRYVYDAWGNQEVRKPDGSELVDQTHIGNLNPYRYRGYYYDVETKLYYLKTRYYDPEVGRFITIDDLSYLDPETINGLNLYVYCGNNPIMNVDPEGTSWWSNFWKWLGTAVAVVVAVVVGIVVTVASFGAATPLVGLGLAVLGGAMLGLAGGVVGSVTTQVQQSGWANVDLGKAWIAGGIGAISGAITGALSFGVGKIAEGIGKTVGFALSQMSVKGLQVSKVFSPEIMIAAFGKGSSLFGGAVATYFGDYIGSNLFGNPYTDNNAKDTTKNILLDWILQFGRWIYNL